MPQMFANANKTRKDTLLYFIMLVVNQHKRGILGHLSMCFQHLTHGDYSSINLHFVFENNVV